MPQKILILGIGNVLYADEGIGVHFAHYFQAKYAISGEARDRMDIDQHSSVETPLIGFFLECAHPSFMVREKRVVAAGGYFQ